MQFSKRGWRQKHLCASNYCVSVPPPHDWRLHKKVEMLFRGALCYLHFLAESQKSSWEERNPLAWMSKEAEMLFREGALCSRGRRKSRRLVRSAFPQKRDVLHSKRQTKIDQSTVIIINRQVITSSDSYKSVSNLWHPKEHVNAKTHTLEIAGYALRVWQHRLEYINREI